MKNHVMHFIIYSTDAKECYNSLLCPELLLWIAEATGFDVSKSAKKSTEIIDEELTVV